MSALAACSTAVETDQQSSIEDYTCAQLADDAVALGEGPSGVALLKVREPDIIRDNRSQLVIPTGDGETTILRCRGTGVFSNGENGKVEIAATIDADEDTFISWQAVE